MIANFALGRNLELVSSRPRWNPLAGIVTETTFEGTKAAVYGVAAVLLADPALRQLYTWQIDDSATPKHRITVNSPENEYVALWDLDGNSLDTSLWQHPRMLKLASDAEIAADSDISEKRRRWMKQALDYQIPGQPGYVDPAVGVVDTSNGSSVSGAFTPEMLKFYKLFKYGTESYHRSQYVLRVNITMPPSFALPAPFQTFLSYNNDNRIIGTTVVNAFYSVPSTILNQITSIPLPLDSEGNPITSATIPVGYAWGWLQQTPKVTQHGPLKFQLQQEWWLELWATAIYGNVIVS